MSKHKKAKGNKTVSPKGMKENPAMHAKSKGAKGKKHGRRVPNLTEKRSSFFHKGKKVYG